MRQISNPIRLLTEAFTRLPENVPSRHYRFFVFGNYFYFLDIFAHAISALINGLLGIPALVLYNVGSMLIYTLALLLNLKGFLKTSLVLLVAETVIYSILQVLATGDTGTNPILILMCVIIFFSSIESTLIKAALSGLVGIIYAILQVYVRIASPIIALEPSITYSVGFIASCVVVFIASYMANYFSIGAATAEAALEREQQRSERLLLNVLPKAIVDRLKKSPGVIADRFETATILFADVVGFTPLSERLPPESIVAILDEIFTAFDDLVDRHGVEKIKTTGDAYVVAAGLPESRKDHAQVIADLALDMQAAMRHSERLAKQGLEIRMGIDSGPVVAGIIGKKKFVYDLWGDTVNTAARMESHGLPSEIQVTQATYDLLRGTHRFEKRAPIQVKGKGEMVVYLLRG